MTCDLRLNDGVEEIFFCRDQVEVKGRSGDIVSLIPWQGNVEEVKTENHQVMTVMIANQAIEAFSGKQIDHKDKKKLN